MSEKMILAGDNNTPAMPMTDAEMNHLRRLLAWMRCEWMLDGNMQAGCVDTAAWLVEHGHTTPEAAGAMLTERAAKINECPACVRQAVKMLTKALREHERRSGIVDAERQAPPEGGASSERGLCSGSPAMPGTSSAA